MGYGLAIHTTSPELGLAINNFAGDARCQTWAIARETSSQLHVLLQAFIQPQTWQDLDFIAVAKGPGGFTGTRIGMVTARTLAQQLNLPLFAISTLATCAHAADQVRRRSQSPSLDLAMQMRAQQGEWFVAIYTAETIVPVLPDVVMSLNQWEATLADWPQPYHLIQLEGNLGGTVASVLQLAYRDWQAGQRPEWSQALPFYGQLSVQ
jgi:tRNA threonylcarbamoyl adenosine modification protein YeaZ